jgi:hypothetical protein
MLTRGHSNARVSVDFCYFVCHTIPVIRIQTPAARGPGPQSQYYSPNAVRQGISQESS